MKMRCRLVLKDIQPTVKRTPKQFKRVYYSHTHTTHTMNGHREHDANILGRCQTDYVQYYSSTDSRSLRNSKKEERKPHILSKEVRYQHPYTSAFK